MKKICFVFLSLIFIGHGAFGEKYCAWDDPHQQGSYEYESSSDGYTGYDSYPAYAHKGSGYRYHRVDSEPEYGGSTESYYSCPRGDYISDRPGRCPLDGSVLVPRVSVERRGPVRYRGTTYSEY